MWLAYAAGSAVFAGLTAILAKIGIRKTDSTVATAIRTVVVLIMSWAMVFVVGSQGTLGQIDRRSLIFLGLSGHGGKLAVLLPGAEAGERQPCGPHRQTEYRADHPAGVPAPGGALRGGPGVRDGAYRRGDPAHGGEKGRDAAV